MLLSIFIEVCPSLLMQLENTPTINIYDTTFILFDNYNNCIVVLFLSAGALHMRKHLIDSEVILFYNRVRTGLKSTCFRVLS